MSAPLVNTGQPTLYTTKEQRDRVERGGMHYIRHKEKTVRPGGMRNMCSVHFCCMRYSHVLNILGHITGLYNECQSS